MLRCSSSFSSRQPTRGARGVVGVEVGWVSATTLWWNPACCNTVAHAQHAGVSQPQMADFTAGWPRSRTSNWPAFPVVSKNICGWVLKKKSCGVGIGLRGIDGAINISTASGKHGRRVMRLLSLQSGHMMGCSNSYNQVKVIDDQPNVMVSCPYFCIIKDIHCTSIINY